MTTLKDSATQLLIKYKSGALGTQYKVYQINPYKDGRFDYIFNQQLFVVDDKF